MWQLLIGILLIILSFFKKDVSGGGYAVEWFDPKTFVTGTKWRIGSGPDPSAVTKWEAVVPKKWSNQLTIHDRDGFCLKNAEHVMRWQPWNLLPDEKTTWYLRQFKCTLETLTEGTFLMSPFLRAWQNEHMYNYVKTGDKLFDIGIGTGRSKDLWMAKNLEVWGVEPNVESINLLEKRKWQIKSQTGQITLHLQPWGGEDPQIMSWIPRETIDVVMMSFSITFFFHSPERLDALVRNINHVLKPSGTFILIGMDGAVVNKWFSKETTLDNPLFKIIRKYDKLSTFGSEIEITMKGPNTLVEAQTEYLVDFDHFRKVLSKAGLKCIRDAHADPAEYLGPWTQKFVSAQRFLAFCKT